MNPPKASTKTKLRAMRLISSRSRSNETLPSFETASFQLEATASSNLEATDTANGRRALLRLGILNASRSASRAKAHILARGLCARPYQASQIPDSAACRSACLGKSLSISLNVACSDLEESSLSLSEAFAAQGDRSPSCTAAAARRAREAEHGVCRGEHQHL